MGKNPPGDDTADELRRKLVLLEGDKKAHYESTQATIAQNADTIETLRRENKSMTARIKSLKAPSAAPAGPRALELLDSKIAEQIKRHNALRYQAQAKQKQLQQLQEQLHKLDEEEKSIQQAREGESSEAQRLRELENRLEKATIKAQEAQHIGRTYQQIITKLQQDRLSFDGIMTQTEKAIAARKADLADVQAMKTDACAARDQARKELQQTEQECQAARAEHEAEKKRLDLQVEQRRQQYEAIEKRLRLASSFPHVQFFRSFFAVGAEDFAQTEQAKQKIVSYEEAMEKIKSATGVSDAQEVYDRFLSQGQTMEHLTKLRDENQARLEKLREEHHAALKQFEAQKYTGEARAASNQRMLDEFSSHLRSVEQEFEQAKAGEEQGAAVLVKVKAGIDSLFEKLDCLNPVQNPDPNNAKEKLAEAELRLCKLLETLEEEKANLAPAKLPLQQTLPMNNTRVLLASTSQPGDNSDSDDDEVISRDAMKRTAQNLIDSRNAKPKPKKGTRKRV
eukprot:m.142281 g.142281  ORF g.142281 m.142281 type:complete len:510 (+) comp20401_c0_seq1:42-1571(+)